MASSVADPYARARDAKQVEVRSMQDQDISRCSHECEICHTSGRSLRRAGFDRIIQHLPPFQSQVLYLWPFCSRSMHLSTFRP